VTDIQVKFAEKGVGYQCGKYETASAGFIDGCAFD
jgi:hypothetical protein